MPAVCDNIKAVITQRYAYSDAQAAQCSLPQYGSLAMVGSLHAIFSPGIKWFMYMQHCAITMVFCCLAAAIIRCIVD